MFVQHVFDLPSKIGGNIIAGLQHQLDHTSRVLSITRNGGWINGNCGHRLECIDGASPGERLEIFVIHYEVSL
jgi:hypothetical protein